jgi:hypothetical protein
MTGLTFAGTEAVNQGTAAQIAVDFSQMDLIAGVSVGVIMALGLALLVLWALVKAGVIRFGKPEPHPAPCAHIGVVTAQCVEHLAEKERSINNRENITKLWEKYDDLVKTLNNGIERLHQNQNTLMLGLIHKGMLPKDSKIS